MSVNKAILLGNLGKDPEIRYTADEKPVASETQDGHNANEEDYQNAFDRA